MDSMQIFMRETYVMEVDSKLPVKEIYDDFREWIVEKYGIPMWNTMSQRIIYKDLKQMNDYPYIRYKEGFCLKGIARKTKIQSPILNIIDEHDISAKLSLTIVPKKTSLV